MADNRSQSPGRSGVDPTVQDNRAQSSGRSGANQNNDAFDNTSRDLAAQIAKRAYEEAKQQNEQLPIDQRQDVSFKAEAPSLYQGLQRGAADIANATVRQGSPIGYALGNLLGIFHADTSAPSERDPYLRAQYLPDGYLKQNTEIAIARLVGHDPSLVRHPHLLFNAAVKDMKAHDVQRLATYADFAQAFNALIANPDGWHNAAKTMLDRIESTPANRLLVDEGKGLETAAHWANKVIKPVVNFVDKTRTSGDVLFANAVGVEGELTTDENGGSSFKPTGGNPAGRLLFDGLKTIEQAPGAAVNWAFDVQRNIRTLHDIKARQGDTAYYAALASIVGTTAVLTFATDGLGILLRKLEGRLLTKALAEVGIDIEGAGLAELRKLANEATTPAKHLRYIRAANQFIKRIPPAQQAQVVKTLAREGLAASRPEMIVEDIAGNVNAYTRAGGVGLRDAEQLSLFPEEAAAGAEAGAETGAVTGEAEAGAAGAAEAEGPDFTFDAPESIFGRMGDFVGRNSGTIGKVARNTVGLGWKYPKVPLNFQLGGQLLFGTGAFGIEPQWQESWDRTYHGDEYVDPITKRPVSLGRDVAGSMFQPDSFWYNAVSGPLDLLTYFEFDPTMSVLKPLTEARRLAPLRNREDVYNFFATNRNGKAMAERIVSENTKAKEVMDKEVEKLLSEWKTNRNAVLRQLRALGMPEEKIRLNGNTTPTRSQLEMIVRATNAEADSYSTIARVFEPLTRSVSKDESAPVDIVAKLTNAKSFDEVVETFGDLAEAQALIDPYRIAPYGVGTTFKDWLYTLNRHQLLNPSESKIEQAIEKVQAKLARGMTNIRPIYFPELGAFSNQIGKVGDPGSLGMLRRALLASGRRPDVVELVINRLARSATPEEYNTVYRNFVQDHFNNDAAQFISDLKEHAGFSEFEAAILRNALLDPFKVEINKLKQTMGGGASKSVYTGIEDNAMVNKNNPYSDTMYNAFGLLENHEHYFALPDYRAFDKLKQELLSGLSSKDPQSLRAHILSKADELIGKPFDEKIAGDTRLLQDWERRIGNMQDRLAALDPDSEKYAKLLDQLASAESTRNGIKSRIDSVVEARKAEVTSRLGDFDFYSDLGKLRNKANVGIHTFHDRMRHWMTDVYFRKLALSTGSFSMRVGSSEAIANTFRLGAKEYSKGWLANKVAQGLVEAVKTQENKVVVPEEERNVIMSMVYDTLQAIFKPVTSAKETIGGAKDEFLTGLAKGLDLDKFVERLSKDIYERNGHLWGLGASHHMIDDYGVFHNLGTGHGTGSWERNSVVDNRYLAGLSKVLNDRAESKVSSTVAGILSRHLNPKIAGGTFDERLAQARLEAAKAIEEIIAKDPKGYSNLIRTSGDFINLSTFRRIENEIKAEYGVSEINNTLTRSQLALRLNKVNAIEEYANALVDDLLWVAHGRGKTTETFSANMVKDKMFHRDVLELISTNKIPRDPERVRQLYAYPNVEQARTEYKRTTSRAKSVEPRSYHDTLYEPGWDPHDLSTMTPEERKNFNIAEFKAGAEGEEARKDPDWYYNELRRMISESVAPKKTGFRNKFAGRSKGSIDRLYQDINGEVSSRFPANVPVQTEIAPSSALENLVSKPIDKFSNTVHERISEPVINGLSRNPLYATELNRQLNVLEPLIKSGVIEEDAAMVVARQRAIEHAIQYVHNPQDRYVLEQWARGFAPFWFAKNQALRRAGRLAVSDPARFEQYVRAMLVMQNYGASSVQNAEDNSALLMPGSIMGGKLMTHLLHTIGLAPSGGVPVGLTGSTSSLASVFPWTDPTGMNTGNTTSLIHSVRPDFGPMVSLPIRWIAMNNPYSKTAQQVNEMALGHIGSRSSLLQQFIPNSLIRSLISMGASQLGVQNSVTNSIDALQAGLLSQALDDRHQKLYKRAVNVATQDYHDRFDGTDNPPNMDHWVHSIATAYVNEGIYQNGKLVQQPISYYIVDPLERTDLINKTHQAALALYAGRTALSFFSPLALSTTQVNPEMMKLIRETQKTGGDFSKAEKLFQKHPEAIYYAVHRTASEAGVSLPATLDMARFQTENADLFKQGGLSSGLVAFVPYSNEGDQFDSHEYHAQLSAGIRRKLSSDEFMKDMARVVGNNYAYNYLPKMVDNLFGGSSSVLKQARAFYAKGNPLWAKTQGDTSKSRITALDQVRRLLDIPGLNKRAGFKETAPLVREIVSKYDEYSNRYQFADPGYHDYVQQQWDEWLANYVAEHPKVSIGVSSIFQGLKLRDNK